MKNTFFHVSRAAALTVCAFTASQMQAALIPTVSVNVPFEFMVAGKTLPAGSYTIASANSKSGASIFVVRNNATNKGVFSVMRGRSWPKATDPKTPQVVFACRDENCYMQELKIPGSDGYVAPLPKLTPAQRERQVALNAGYAAVGK